MSDAVGDQLKALYNSGDYSKVDFPKIKMSTEGMGSGNVIYNLSIPFLTVTNKCEAGYQLNIQMSHKIHFFSADMAS